MATNCYRPLFETLHVLHFSVHCISARIRFHFLQSLSELLSYPNSENRDRKPSAIEKGFYVNSAKKGNLPYHSGIVVLVFEV